MSQFERDVLSLRSSFRNHVLEGSDVIVRKALNSVASDTYTIVELPITRVYFLAVRVSSKFRNLFKLVATIDSRS